jgi:hypothetical protein
MRIRIQGFDDQKLRKKIKLKNLFPTGCPSYGRSLQPSKEDIQHFEKWIFNFFLFLWVIFALLDPDPRTH